MKLFYIIVFQFIATFANAQIKHGLASYYHSKFHGKKTATGEIFDNTILTAASNVFKLGTRVIVTNLSNGKKVEVLINDRMAKYNKRLIDLSHAAAKRLDMIKQGKAKVSVEIIHSTAEEK
ncbi:MAG TPA: septal ring lytic transglycosylase RlpA family protein [Chitinophagaceae bacterium]|nr:MAG: rare lipoprotein A [Bacteroidetes bacterium OLB11]HMN31764.1 septal ring lytic transglycosylase RlpA family protein [Chitinophagaceae bacterium]